MPFEPLRFIHAAGLRLDVPVHIWSPEQLGQELRHEFEDATLSAFEFLIDQCIGLDIDFLLLSGGVFVEADRSLRARLALLQGAGRLREAGIPVLVLPGDTDPSEAWQAIPDLPDNVLVCHSSLPEPLTIRRDDQILVTASSTTWYGESDAFGIRVISNPQGAPHPFRIGLVTRRKFEDSQRLQELSSSEEDRLLTAALSGDAESEPETAREAESAPADASAEPEEGLKTSDQPSHPASHGNAAGRRDSGQKFREYVSGLMREGRLNYLAFGGETSRTTFDTEFGPVHAPGTLQPRHGQEASSGMCTVVDVDADGTAQLTALNTSVVDWKDLELEVDQRTNLSSLLQAMKSRLLRLPVHASDRVWAIRWTLRGPLPVIDDLAAEDVETAVAVEIDELSPEADERSEIRLIHQVRMVPDAWTAGEENVLASRYAEAGNNARYRDPEWLRQKITDDDSLTAGVAVSSCLPVADD